MTGNYYRKFLVEIITGNYQLVYIVAEKCGNYRDTGYPKNYPLRTQNLDPICNVMPYIMRSECFLSAS